MKVVMTYDAVYTYASGSALAVGGAERYQWLLARALAANGWTVTVGVREALPLGQRTRIEGVEFVGIGKGQILLAWYRFLLSEQPDWWYWQCAYHLLGPAVAIAKLAHVKMIFSAMHDRDVQPRHALSLRPRWWPLYAWGLLWADKVFVQHGGQQAALVPRWRSEATILPGIVDKMAKVKSHFERVPYVAWVAMLRQVKRPDVLVEIARRAPSIRFVVCGGTTRHRSPPGYGERVVDALRTLPNIEFLGRVAPEKALQVIAGAAMLLSTSDEEGFPSTFLEAWASGTPVVSLKIDPDGIIARAGLGTVPGTIENAIADLNTFMAAPQRREEIAVRAQKYIAEAHSEVGVTAIFKQALQSIHS
jgi:glycosyltransferase involved in cell wall biosynthesis